MKTFDHKIFTKSNPAFQFVYNAKEYMDEYQPASIMRMRNSKVIEVDLSDFGLELPCKAWIGTENHEFTTDAEQCYDFSVLIGYEHEESIEALAYFSGTGILPEKGRGFSYYDSLSQLLGYSFLSAAPLVENDSRPFITIFSFGSHDRLKETSSFGSSFCIKFLPRLLAQNAVTAALTSSCVVSFVIDQCDSELATIDSQNADYTCALDGSLVCAAFKI